VSGFPVYWARNVGVLTEVVINTAAGGDIVISPAVAQASTKLYRLLLLCNGTTNLIFKDGANPLSGPLPFTAGGGMVLDFSGDPWYVGSLATNFIINSSNAVQISGTAWIVVTG
jgi:hypothetical protein